MAAKPGITVPIYKIDTDAANDFFGGEVEVGDLPAKIITQYNKDKGVETYSLEGTATIDGCAFSLYRNVKAQPNTSGWVSFFKSTGIQLGNITNQMQHLVCFVVVDGELFAYTAGQSVVAFDRFIDIAFPIEVGRRIAKGEVKGVRSSQITGSTLASDVHFRDPRRLTYTESLDNVWTALSGQVRDEILAEKALTDVFGSKTKVRLDVTSAIKLGPRIEKPGKLVQLIRWLASKAESDPPADDPWAVLDAIKVLNPRKRKDLIANLKRTLAEKIFAAHDYSNMAVAHIDSSLYDNATMYVVSQDGDVLYESEERPDLADFVKEMTVDGDKLVDALTAAVIKTENSDYGAGYGTSGPLLAHLYGEIRYGKKTYFLLAGKWYEVDAVYIEQVTRDFLAIMSERNIEASAIGLGEWRTSDSEGTYNESSINSGTFINGDRVLTDNVELFDGLASDGKATYVIHVKRDFDVKVRDVRSQVLNSAQIIENDLRGDSKIKLKEHYAHLKSRGKTELSETEFLELFELPRTYVLAYGSRTKVDVSTIDKFQSSVARMEVVALNNQFRQLSSADSQAKLQITWIRIVD